MNAWQFTSEAYPVQTRDEYWKETLERLGFHIEPTSAERAMHDIAVSRTSPRGVEFIRISSNAQSLHHRCANDKLLLCLPIEGSGTHEPSSCAIGPGDVLIVPPGQSLSLTFPRRFRLLTVRMPREVISLRVLGPEALKLKHVRDRAGFAKVFSCLLVSVSENLETLTGDDFRALDIAVAEMLLACLATGSKSGTGGQVALLHRIRQDIEARLGDPSLSPASVAEAGGLSERYVQKLFETASENFSSFVRRRRLERCRSDLRNPQCDHLSISDICFRWGFNDASHFSRAFRDQFGLSPKAYRHQNEVVADDNNLALISRGRPQQTRAILRQGEHVDPPL
jgi:AraC-like DNA-binding protein